MTRLYRPNHVALKMPPLVGTMRSAANEHAAAMVVRTCQLRDDRWEPVSPKQIEATLDADLRAKGEWTRWASSNPFFRPDFGALIRTQYVTWSGGVDGKIAFTDDGFEVMKRHVSAFANEILVHEVRQPEEFTIPISDSSSVYGRPADAGAPCDVHDWPLQGLGKRLVKEMKARHETGGINVCAACITRARSSIEKP